MEGLVGTQVEVTVSDPWEFGTQHGTGPFAATVLRAGRGETGQEALLLRLRAPLAYRGVNCEYLVASPRHTSGSLSALTAGGGAVSCGFTVIGEERAAAPDPLDLSWWRGGVGLIGTLRRV